MRRFAALFTELDGTRSTERKLAALEAYFRAAPPGDAAWALWLLSGNRLGRAVPARTLAAWTLRRTGLAPWLLEASLAATGDLAEAIALLLEEEAPGEEARGEEASGEQAPGEPARPGAAGDAPAQGLAAWVERLRALAPLAEEERAARIDGWWRGLAPVERLLLVKALTGELRVGVSRTLVERGLARALGLAPPAVAERLAGAWTPSAPFFEALRRGDDLHASTRPYPSMLAVPLAGPPAEALGPDPGPWVVEWKWDGVRAQAVRRGGASALWSRGDELLTARFPEVRRAVDLLPEGTVLDGELLVVVGDRPRPFAALQRRTGRTRPGARVLRELPAALLAFDCLARGGEDLRARPLEARRAALAEVVAALPPEARAALRVAPDPPPPATWAEAAALRAAAPAGGAEGLVLKRRDAPYQGGRRRGAWWKWKVDARTFDAVLVAAQPGHGRRASLHTDLTFAVWDEGALVTVARAYSGLTDAELRALDAWVRANTLERFGPVRTVTPHHVFELACEGVARSTRHQAGVAVRFPRIARWRADKRPADADALDALRALLPPEPPRPRPEDVPGAQLTLFEP